MAINQEENLGPMKLIFNYNNVFYSFFYDDLSGCRLKTGPNPPERRNGPYGRIAVGLVARQ